MSQVTLDEKMEEILSQYFTRQEVGEELDEDFIDTMKQGFKNKDGFKVAKSKIKKLITLKKNDREKYDALTFVYSDGEKVRLGGNLPQPQKKSVASNLRQKLEEIDSDDEIALFLLNNKIQFDMEQRSKRYRRGQRKKRKVETMKREVSKIDFEPVDDVNVFQFNEARNELEKIIDKAKEKDNLGILDTQ